MELAEKFAANIGNTKGCITYKREKELKIIISKNNYEYNKQSKQKDSSAEYCNQYDYKTCELEQ